MQNTFAHKQCAAARTHNVKRVAGDGVEDECLPAARHSHGHPVYHHVMNIAVSITPPTTR
jgi:hypothetical protein